MGNYKQLLRNVRTFIFDVDGVMTDGSVLVMPEGEMLRTMNVKDGYALQLAVKKGYNIAIISGGNCKSIRHRFTMLGINEIYLGVSHKLEVFKNYLEKTGISADTILYMGDDLPDYPVMQKVGVPSCPADAAEEIKSISKYISIHKGGDGCVRDVIEQVMKIQESWFSEDGFQW